MSRELITLGVLKSVMCFDILKLRLGLLERMRGKVWGYLFIEVNKKTW